MENSNLSTNPEKRGDTPLVAEATSTQVKTSIVNRQAIIAVTGSAALILAGTLFLFFLWKRSQTAIVLPTASPEAVSESTLAETPAEATLAAAAVSPLVAPAKVDTTGWATYSDQKAGFSFKYPPTLVAVNSEALSDNQLSLSVAAEKLADIPEDLPSFMGRNDALKEKALLAEGKGEGFVKIGSLYGNTSSTYSMFEVCSVMFVRKLKFYPGDYRVMLSLTAPEAKMTAAMPDFFQVDPKNCGNNLMWNQDKKTDFETTLQNHQGVGLAQTWYDTFYGIASTVQLMTPVANPSPSVTPVSSVAPSPTGLTYKNETYGFELTYEKPYRVLTSKNDLYGYPKGVALLYTGGQAYDIVIEVWDAQAAYEKEYAGRLADLKVIKNKGKFITLLNNNPGSAENKKIIDSVKVFP